jgi:uncharacterized protein (DUF433 family)
MAAEPELTIAADAVGHIVKTKGVVGGKARIAGTRIRVMDVVVWYEHSHWSVKRILKEFPTITAADVHAALAYYHDNREEIEESFRAAERTVQEFIRDFPDRALLPHGG